jgi:capsular polysaccharide biosynthesis protein
MYQNYNISNPLTEHLNQVQSSQCRNNSINIIIAAGIGFILGITIMYFLSKNPGGIKVEDAVGKNEN